MDEKSLSHTSWNCKYHIVLVPKYRRKVIYGKVRRDLSRYVFAKQCAIRIDKQQKRRYNNAVIDNDIII